MADKCDVLRKAAIWDALMKMGEILHSKLKIAQHEQEGGNKFN
jgi:hypothetical protein